jgi:D-3-phosphoglycerate dehydrogenase / 2-oxoglutarate reductase
MQKVLISDSLNDGWQDVFADVPDVTAESRTGLSRDEFLQAITEYHGLIVRSGTQVTREVIEAGSQLRVVGRAGAGVDNIDIAAATERGIVVLNAPGGNTVSTAEHSFGMLLALSRNIPQATASVKAGQWDRKRYTGVELHGKVLGIIGVGRVGQQVATRARAFGMTILGHDPFLSDELAAQLHIRLASLDEIYAEADYISLHSPLTDGTRHLISRESLALCKRGVRIINCARGGLADEEALLEGILDGKVAGVALDVYEQEPPGPEHPLLSREEVVCTPHLGASTLEAQEKVARQIARDVLEVLCDRPVQHALNMPSVDPAIFETIKPYLLLAESVGTLQAQLSRGHLRRIAIEYHGDVLRYATSPMTAAVLKGAISNLTDDPVSFVNAPLFAQRRGVNIDETRSSDHRDYANLITVNYETSEGATTISGTIFGKHDPRIVRVDGFDVNAKLSGDMLFVCNEDVPGVVGLMGTMLAEEGINIADMALGRESRGGRAIMALSIDEPVSEEVRARITSAPEVIWVRQARL